MNNARSSLLLFFSYCALTPFLDLLFFSAAKFDTRKLRTAQMKIQSKETDKTISPTPEDPERRATHRVTLVCHRQSPPLPAIPATTSRMLSRLRMTRSLATAISKPAAPSDAECEARAGPSPWQAGSRKPLFRGTTDRPLHRPIPLIWPCLGGRPTRDRCVLSSSWQPLTPHHPCRPSLVVLIRHNAKWRSGSCQLRAERPNRGNPSATISKRRASPGLGAAKSMSRTITLV